MSPGPDDTREDPGGPLVVVCTGRRCSGLRDLAGDSGQLARLRSAIRDTHGGVLIGADCPGGCPLAAVAGVAHRDGTTGGAGPTVWLRGVHEPARADALADWVKAGGPAPGGHPDADLPVALIEAVAAVGPPPRVSPRGA